MTVFLEEQDEESLNIAPDTIEFPSAIDIPSVEDRNPTLSEALLFEQLQIPSLSSITSCSIVKMLGFNCVSYGNEDEGVRLPYFFSLSVIKRSLQLQETFPNKVMKVSSSKKENEFILQNSPYNRQLSVDSFLQLNKSHIDILNTSWERRPYMKLVSAQLLAGSLIVTDTKAILVNCIEIYSRLPSLEAHTEKDIANMTNSVPTVFSQYPDLSIVKLENDSSAKLVIGTNMSNFLVTSSVRIDNESYLPELGPTTANIEITSNSRVYISEDSIKKCNRIVESKKYKLVMNHELFNLKQIRSKFHLASTYTFSRGFSMFTHAMTNVPLTVFTASYCKHMTSREAKIASSILQEVAWAVIEGGDKLHLSAIKSLITSLPKDGNVTVSKAIGSIEKMFENKEYIQVINNIELNTCLEIISLFIYNNGVASAENVHMVFKS